MKTLPAVFVSRVQDYAERLAVVEKDRSVSYAELDQLVTDRAAQLSGLGVQPGDRVALMLPNGLDFVTGYLAIVSIGAIAVPLNDHYQHTELLYFLDICEVSVLITSQAFEQLCRPIVTQGAVPCQLLFVEEPPRASPVQARAVAPIDPDTPVMYQFSSGSTGQPKRIARTHTQLLFELESLTQTLAITATDHVLGVAPFSHVNGLMRSMLASLYAGATLYPVAKFERQAVAQVIEQHTISVFIAVPFMFAMLAKAHWRRRPDFSTLRWCISASAPLPTAVSQLFYQQFGCYVRQLYGSTETGTISVNVQPDVERSLESVGTPIGGVHVDVCHEDGSTAEAGEVGEIAVNSPAAIRGYQDLEWVNKEVFRGGYFFTGDLGKREHNGQLYLLGRKKFLINKGGYKISPQEIEDLLCRHEKVEEAVVVGLPTAYGDEKVKAVLVANRSCTPEELVAFCRGQIADFKIPSVIEFRDSLPKSPTGKIRRKQLM